MRRFPCRPDRAPTAALVLVLLLGRAYVPVGFMPAMGSPFALEICPAGLDRPMQLHHTHHRGNHAQYENCPFGSAPAAAPIAHIVAFLPAGEVRSRSPIFLSSPPLGIAIARAQRARAPPALA